MGGYFLEGMSWKTVLNSFDRAVRHDNTNILWRTQQSAIQLM